MIEYCDDVGEKGYKLYNLETRKILRGSSRDVIFDEATFIRNEHQQLSEKEIEDPFATQKNDDLIEILDHVHQDMKEEPSDNGKDMGEPLEDVDELFEVRTVQHPSSKGKGKVLGESWPMVQNYTPVQAELAVEGGREPVNEVREKAKEVLGLVLAEPPQQPACPQRLKQPETEWRPGYDSKRGTTTQMAPKSHETSRSITCQQPTQGEPTIKGAKVNIIQAEMVEVRRLSTKSLGRYMWCKNKYQVNMYLQWKRSLSNLSSKTLLKWYLKFHWRNKYWSAGW
jgi:hypothetical protein